MLPVSVLSVLPVLSVLRRSGRVSKPPKILAKDYKQIHRVDWYEDYDDDDGGYSDIYVSDDDNTSDNTGLCLRYILPSTVQLIILHLFRRSQQFVKMSIAFLSIYLFHSPC